MESFERFCGKLWPCKCVDNCPKCERRLHGFVALATTKVNYVLTCEGRAGEHIHADCDNCGFKYAVEVANAS